MENLRAKDYREIAADKCRPFSGRLALIYLIYALILGAVGAIGSFGGNNTSPTYWVLSSISAIAILLLFGPFVFGLILVIEDVFAKKLPDYARIFDGFKTFFRAFLINLLQGVFIFLWSLLFVIPGIIKTFSYAMSDHIAIDHPEKTEIECITESRKLMDGHKWQLFCLEISYIGWFLLCVLTLGILCLWVMPKFEAAKYAFYLNLIGKNPKN